MKKAWHLYLFVYDFNYFYLGNAPYTNKVWANTLYRIKPLIRKWGNRLKINGIK